METTQTGVPIIDCAVCDTRHPESREHCVNCGRATVFIAPSNMCLKCDTWRAIGGE